MTGQFTHGNTVNAAGDGHSAWLLRIYLLAGDRFQGKPLAEVILRAAREEGIRGATVFPGIAGFGKSGRHGALEVFLHDPLQQPLVVEMADEGERLQALLSTLSAINESGRLVTLERLSVLSYHASAADRDSKANHDTDGAHP